VTLEPAAAPSASEESATAAMAVPVLIPAYNPDEKLLGLVEALVRSGFRDIIVVDDGSEPACGAVFAALERNARCRVIRHAVNLGKGRAIKTGLNHFYLAHGDAPGVVTADADGQHTATDVRRVAEAFQEAPQALVIGARRFDRRPPLRSLVGNTITRHVFRLLVGKKISDTQSGLRCIPREAVPRFLQLDGERYEYEMSMLIATKTGGIPVVEVGISTVYIDGNRSSHFNPLVDSMKIYFLLLRFFFSSAFASSVDFAVFSGIYFLSDNVLLSIVCARAIAGNINFFINRRLVFRSSANVAVAILKYYSLLVVLAGLASLAIGALSDAGVNVILAKALTETLLFIASFSIQRDYIFGSRGERRPE
jgi:glycosyltransferase involved in cell wall biosynthesis